MTAGAPEPIGQLEVEVDLQLSIDGVEATLVGRGQDLRLETDHPWALLGRLATVRSAIPSRRTAVAAAADTLAEQGLTVTAAGRRGPSVVVGAGASSPLALGLVGTSRVQVVGVTPRQGLLVAVGLATLAWWAKRLL